MKIVEYRGVEGLVYAPVICDDNESGTGHGYVTGAVKPLAGVAEISKATNSTDAAHYYDNMPAVVISSTGDDTVTINASAIPLPTYAEITGQKYSAATGALIEGPRNPGYFAIGYKTKDTDGNEYYVWRLKGRFGVPDQTNATEDDGTDANGQTLTFTSIMTTHIFQNVPDEPARAKAVNVNTGLGLLADKDAFFETVQTPDTIAPANPVPSVSVVPSRAVIEAGEDVTLQVVVVPAGTAVSWNSSATTYATVANGVVHGEAEGSATITASITVDGTTYSDTCAVTVNAVEA